MKKIYLMKTLLLLFALVAGSGSVWAEDVTTTYTFTSKAWAATEGNWTSGKDGNQFTSGRGIQVTTGATDANATSPTSFTNVSKVVVTYSTNASAGAGSVAIQVGSGTAKSQNVTKTGGTSDRTLEYTFSPVETGNVKITVTCSTNSIYVKSIAITCSTGSEDNRTATSVSIVDSGVNSNIFNGTDGGSLSATVSAGESAIDGASVTWSSSNGDVATINETTGAITLVATGTAIITASYAGDDTYKPSSAAYELEVIYNNPDAITLWSEDFSSYSANDVPAEGTYNYSCVNGSTDTKIYNEHNAGGTAPELLVGKNGGRFSATIPLNNIEGNLRLTYRTNARRITVSNDLEGGSGFSSETLGEHAVIISGVTHVMTEITITFAAGGSDNVRLDDIHLEGSEYKPAVVAPTFSVPGGIYYTAQSVELSCATEGATIYYTTDGTDPTSESTVYSGPISVTEDMTIKAIAIKDSDESEIAEATYTISQKDDVDFYIENQTLAYGSTFTLEADVHYFTDGEVTLTSDNDEVVTIDGLTVTAAAVGTATITVDAEEGDTFNAGSKTFTVTVTAPEGLTTAPTGTPAGTIFEETFAGCEGTGSAGNFSETGNDAIVFDNKDWTYGSANAADGCGKFGSSKKPGYATTPAITVINGTTYTLTFKAAPWAEEQTKMVVTVDGGTISGISSDAMETLKWNEYSATITATSNSIAITFEADKYRFFLDDIKVVAPEIAAPAITAKLNAAGFATFCSKYPLDFTNAEADGYSAWQITEIDFDKITFEQITGNVKGGTGIFLKGTKGTAGETITLTSVDSETVLSDNKLVGTLAPTYVGNDEYYGLSGNNFVKINAGTVPACKAIIDADHITEEAGGLARFTFIFADATGISEVEHGTLNADETVYDLQGRRVVKAQKGLYIVNGKKVIMK